jgi:UDP-glucose 4-epimerase
MVGKRKIPITITGIRPGEKIHELLVSEEESYRTVERQNYYVIQPMLPELCPSRPESRCLTKEYSSGDDVMTFEETRDLLQGRRLMPEDMPQEAVEVLC